MLGLFLASTALSIAVGSVRLLVCDAHDHPTPLGRLESWVLFLLGFGMAGAPMILLGVGTALTLTVAAMSGVTLGAVTLPLFAESPPPPSVDDVGGREGRVVLPVSATAGRVVVDSLAHRIELPARSVDGTPLPIGRRVLIAFVERGVAHVLGL
ncbi:MAG: hypothetical protein H6738_12515 [Alphaproteobacteria bacterium]|nr:hypothetical protein [Alphaproteobacteria bacterium]